MKAFAIVRADGEIRRRRGGQGNLCVYSRLAVAKNVARDEGDSVVEVEIDLSKEPLFIRGLKL